MPELPEVETVVQGIRPFIMNKTIKDIIIRNPNLRYKMPDGFSDNIVGAKIHNVLRRAKYILLETDNNQVIVVHLGMSGSLIAHTEHSADYKKHDHVVFIMAGKEHLIYNDPRRFGLVLSMTTNEVEQHQFFKHLGPEPLTNQFHHEYLTEVLSSKKAPIKTALMDNSIVVGVGNIYACESLFRSGIVPTRPANTVSEIELERLTHAIREVLQQAIDSGGSTLRDYVNSSGDSGYFQHSFSVYGREGEDCIRCGATVKRIKQAGRSTFYCDRCQK